MGVKRVLDKRICSACGSTTTYTTKEGYSRWCRLGDGTFICLRCKNKRRNPFRSSETIRRANAMGNERRRGRWQSYRGKRYTRLYDIRCGVCNWCRAVAGIDTSYTNLHHDENRYDDSDHLRFTLELCVECHGRESIRLQGSGAAPH